jgi:hypothetical protein
MATSGRCAWVVGRGSCLLQQASEDEACMGCRVLSNIWQVDGGEGCRQAVDIVLEVLLVSTAPMADSGGAC